MKRRNELNMKPAAVIHMLSPRNFKIGSYTRSPHVGGLATVSRHPAVVHAGGGVSIYIYVCIQSHAGIYVCICTCRHISYICMHVGFLLPAKIQVSAGLSIQSNLFELALQAPTIHTPSQNTNLQVMLHN